MSSVLMKMLYFLCRCFFNEQVSSFAVACNKKLTQDNVHATNRRTFSIISDEDYEMGSKMFLRSKC